MSATHAAKTLPEQIADALAERISQSRLDTFGGYPDEWTFLGELIVVAGLRDGHEPELTIKTVPDYIVSVDCWMEDDDELQARFDRCMRDPVFRRKVAAARRRERVRSKQQLARDAEWRASYEARRDA